MSTKRNTERDLVFYADGSIERERPYASSAPDVAGRAKVLCSLIARAREVSEAEDPDGCDIVKLRYASPGHRLPADWPKWIGNLESENVDTIERVLSALGL
jgi:hypothetical protein